MYEFKNDYGLKRGVNGLPFSAKAIIEQLEKENDELKKQKDRLEEYGRARDKEIDSYILANSALKLKIGDLESCRQLEAKS